MTYQHPLAHVVGLEGPEGPALLRTGGGEHDRAFVEARLAEVRQLVADEELAGHPGVDVEGGATDETGRSAWAVPAVVLLHLQRG